ncbi:MAG: DUF1501 domain-containing protein [Gemmataceae bacterium]
MNKLDRRRFCQYATIGAFGLSLPKLLELDAQEVARGRRERPKSLIFLFLYGGPSQIDVWDMKPEAPAEFRGEFRPIQTTNPALQICEHLPKMAQLAQHYSVIRTLHHVNRNHQPAGCWMLTGVDPRSDNSSQLKPKPDDPPALGSIATRLAPAERNTVPPFVMLPARLNDQGSFFKGQYGGWLGSRADPLLIQGDPNSPTFRVDGFQQQEDISPSRMRRRRDLLRRLDAGLLGSEPETQSLGEFQQQAFELMTSSRGQSAFDLSAEADRVRDRYGRTQFGQGCLLARRLIEAGARVVTVSDCTSAGHHEWDTHNDNFPLLKEKLLPRLDQAYTALMGDLIDRGMLEDTVVYLGGEFGRTPRIGQAGFSSAGATASGRDHYPNCFPGILAGGRVRPGTVYGRSDSRAAFPTQDPVTPEDLAATLFAAMGLDPHGLVYTPENRPMPASHGNAIRGILA